MGKFGQLWGRDRRRVYLPSQSGGDLWELFAKIPSSLLAQTIVILSIGFSIKNLGLILNSQAALILYRNPLSGIGPQFD